MSNVLAPDSAAISVAVRHIPRSKSVVTRMWGYGLDADLKHVLPFTNEPRFLLALAEMLTNAMDESLAVSIKARHWFDRPQPGTVASHHEL